MFDHWTLTSVNVGSSPAGGKMWNTLMVRPGMTFAVERDVKPHLEPLAYDLVYF